MSIVVLVIVLLGLSGCLTGNNPFKKMPFKENRFSKDKTPDQPSGVIELRESPWILVGLGARLPDRTYYSNNNVLGLYFVKNVLFINTETGERNIFSDSLKCSVEQVVVDYEPQDHEQNKRMAPEQLIFKARFDKNGNNTFDLHEVSGLYSVDHSGKKRILLSPDGMDVFVWTYSPQHKTVFMHVRTDSDKNGKIDNEDQLEIWSNSLDGQNLKKVFSN